MTIEDSARTVRPCRFTDIAGREHWIEPDAFEAGWKSGLYVALCGAQIALGSKAFGDPCPVCCLRYQLRMGVNLPKIPRPRQRGRHRRGGWWLDMLRCGVR